MCGQRSFPRQNQTFMCFVTALNFVASLAKRVNLINSFFINKAGMDFRAICIGGSSSGLCCNARALFQTCCIVIGKCETPTNYTLLPFNVVSNDRMNLNKEAFAEKITQIARNENRQFRFRLH